MSCDKCEDTGWVENNCVEYPWASGGLMPCTCPKGVAEAEEYRLAMLENSNATQEK